MRRLRLLALAVPAAACAAVVQAAASPLHAVEPYVSEAPPGAHGVVEAAIASAAPQTPAPTAQPTPVTTPALATPPPSTPRPTAAPPPPPPPVVTVIRDRLRSADGSLNTGVTWYSDCSGATPLTHSAAAIDTCVHNVTYFVGHNPGVFTPLMSENVGALITWWDDAGNAHALRVVAVRSWQRADGVPPPVSSAVVAQFQTCQVADGSVDRILDAVPA